MLGRTGIMGMTEDVTGAVHPGPLAVPHGENAIELAFAAQFGLLRAPDRGSGEVLIDPALETNVALVEKRIGAEKLAVESAQWRPAIAGDKARGIQAVAAIKLLL